MNMEIVGRAHHAVIAALLRTGKAPPREDIAAVLGTSNEEADTAIRDLEAIHGVVLHPGTLDPWIIHPFALSPTATWIEKQGLGWWAPCLWCAFGVCALARGAARIHARLGGEAADVDIDVADGHPRSGFELVAHFAIPPREAWRNVHHHCAMVLPFRNEAAIDDWSARHRLPRGQAVPLARVAELARAWYGRHADLAWRKWTIREAQAIFQRIGLTGDFWDLGAPDDRAF